MGKSTINGHFKSLFVCLPEGKLSNKSEEKSPQDLMTLIYHFGQSRYRPLEQQLLGEAQRVQDYPNS